MSAEPPTLFQSCNAANNGTALEILECVSKAQQEVSRSACIVRRGDITVVVVDDVLSTREG
jgi:hypothetical protein